MQEKQTDEMPAFNRAFQERFGRTMTALLTMPEHEGILLRFLAAFAYRRQFSWLEEYQQKFHVGDQGNLSYALQSTLATYIVSITPVDGDQCKQEDNRQNLHPEQKGHLLIALHTTIDEKSTRNALNIVSRERAFNVTELSQAELQTHILRALDHYYCQWMKGIMGDSF